MKFPRTRSAIIALTFSFTFYSIVGCSSAGQSTKYLDKYDSMPFEDAIVVKASVDAAYKASINVLQKRGYMLTLSDPKTGIANLELNSPRILPEDEKKAQAEDKGLTTGQIILIAVAVVLVVGIIYLIASSSDDSKDKDKKDDNTKNNKNDHPHDNGHHFVPPLGPFVSPFADACVTAPSPKPSFLYIVSVTTTALTDSTTEVYLSTERLDLQNGDVLNSQRFENKYLNYSIFDAIDNEFARR
jgi:hypothetical protein